MSGNTDLIVQGINLTALLPVVRQAGQLVQKIKSNGVSARYKADASPVTVADEQANKLIVAALCELYPDVAVISEEDQDSHSRSAASLYFLVDPLDGTREFLRTENTGAYTVNIGLVHEARAVGGIVYAPAHDWLCWGVAGREAYQMRNGQTSKLAVRAVPETGPVALVSRSHLDSQTKDFLTQHGIEQTVSMGSSLKFSCLAAGQADVHVRFSPTMEWDTAAGEAILAGAGGAVFDRTGQPHRYGKSEWRNGPFVACAGLSVF